MSHDYHSKGGRRDRNIRSRDFASRDNEPWTDEDDEFLLEFWITQDKRTDKDEAEVARAIGRTIESCRVRCEKIRAKLGITVFIRREITVKETTTVYIGVGDEPGDRWWEGPWT